MKHILTLTDFSQLAENAVEAAFLFAKKYGAELTIYHNSEDGDLIMYELVGDPEIEHFTLKKSITTPPVSKWKQLAKKHNVTARYLTGSADFIKKIFDITEILEIDLIVMGSSGAGGRKEIIWGSNTEKVVKHVDIPVLVIKKPITDYRLKNIVFASAFDTKEKEVLKFALNLLNPPADATIHLLSIDTSSFFTQPMALMKTAMEDFVEVAKPYIVKKHFYKDYSIDAGIRHFMEDVKADLLVMSNRNEKPIKRMISGNNTLKAINHSDFPVLSIDYRQ
ncbi:MAG: universal stress protein [Saprospiraceae bacterium]|nr:universal stress protein [Saprospiraceae bacterium]